MINKDATASVCCGIFVICFSTIPLLKNSVACIAGIYTDILKKNFFTYIIFIQFLDFSNEVHCMQENVLKHF